MSVGAVMRIAVLSRLLACTMAIIANALISNYDSSHPVALDAESWEYHILGCFSNWDALYFVDISAYGYQYEHFHAFFPLLPFTMRMLSSVLPGMLLGGVVVSNLTFVVAAGALYKLSFLVLKSERMALTAALLYCFNPASVFNSAIYTESLFAACTFAGMYWWMVWKQARVPHLGTTWVAAVFFALSCATRSNGAINSGFFVFDILYWTIQQRCSMRRLLVLWVNTVLQVSVVVAPMVAVLRTAANVYCSTETEAEAARPWCIGAVPNVYSFVQDHYWNNGFLRYYTFQQLPNFALALPMLVLTCAGTGAYFGALGWRGVLDALGHTHPAGHEGGYTSRHAFPFMVQWSVLAVFAVTCMHVQVATRFLASYPPVYWYCGSVLTTSFEAKGSSGYKGYWIMVYFSFYFIAGALLHSNFLPWT